jgi:hypothetical protein
VPIINPQPYQISLSPLPVSTNTLNTSVFSLEEFAQRSLLLSLSDLLWVENAQTWTSENRLQGKRIREGMSLTLTYADILGNNHRKKKSSFTIPTCVGISQGNM